MNIHVNYDKCAGHAVCEALAPKLFRVGEDGFTHLGTEQLDDALYALLEDVVIECPTGAITIDD